MTDARGETGWERLFWLVFDRTSNPVVLMDEQRRIVDANDAAMRLLGARRGEIVGTSIEQSIPPAERAGSQAQWQDFLKSGQYSGSRDLLRRDGSLLRVTFAASLAVVGGRRLAIYVAMTREEQQPEGPAEAAKVPLTGREREIVTLIALGKETADIAAELHISAETVRSHVRNAMGKLGAHTRAQLVAIALCGEHALDNDSVGA